MLTGTVGAERTFLGAGMGVVVLYLRRGGIVGETLQEEKMQFNNSNSQIQCTVI